MEPRPSNGPTSFRFVEEKDSAPPAGYRLLLSMLIGATILQKFALPFASSKISICLVWLYMMLALLLVLRRSIVIDPARLGLFSLFVCVTVTSTYLNRGDCSTLALLLVIVVYAPFVLKIEFSQAEYKTILDLYQSLILFLVACGALQFIIQFVGGVEAMFPLDEFLPASLFTKGFNLRIPVVQGGDIYKSTGFFLLEPSHFSQVCSLAFLIEMLVFRRLGRICIYLAGLVLSFSGTGIMLLLALAPIVMLRSKSPVLIVLALVVGAVVLLAGDTILVESFSNRINTFSDTQSSAYARFVSPFVIFGDLMHEGGLHFLFGHGAGQMTLLTQATDYESHDTSWIKLTYEYGVLGAGSFFAFFLYALFRGAPRPILAAALFFLFLILGGYLVSPYVAVFILVLGVWPRVQQEEARLAWRAQAAPRPATVI